MCGGSQLACGRLTGMGGVSGFTSPLPHDAHHAVTHRVCRDNLAPLACQHQLGRCPYPTDITDPTDGVPDDHSKSLPNGEAIRHV